VSEQPTGGLAKLPAMLAEMEAAPAIVRPSQFWEHYTALNLEQLERKGFDEFKRTINRNYFQFQLTDPRAPQYRALIAAWLRRPTPAVLRAKLDAPLALEPEVVGRLGEGFANKAYAVYLALLWEYVKRRDRAGLLERLDEPLVGHPVHITYRGHRVSEDLCNSTLELTAILEGLSAGERPRTVVELGSGYGRLAWLVLTVLPDARYMLVDIPPALAVAEEYLTTLFSDRRTFGFRHFDAYDEVAGELDVAQLAFLTPNQLDLLPPQEADLFVNVSSLHEMRPEQIEHYFSAISTHCAGHSYSKQWTRSVNEPDGVIITHDDYPVPDRWDVIFDRTHPVQVEFFEALYRVDGR